MLKLLHKNWYHLLIWTLMIAYVFIAPGFVDQTSRKYGRPIQPELAELKTSDQVLAHVDEMQSVEFEGQYLDTVLGWAYAAVDPNASTENFNRFLILQSDARKYYFQTTPYSRPDIEAGYPAISADLTNAGFKAMLAKEFIRPGRYQLGIVLKQDNGDDYIVWTEQYIVRTGNQIFFGK